MSYELAFLDEALKEWRKLDPVTREQFRAKLGERLQTQKFPQPGFTVAKSVTRSSFAMRATV